MIKQISTTLLLSEEMYTFTGRFLELIERASLKEPFVQRCMRLLKNARATLQAILNQEIGNALTAMIAEKDKARDKAYIFLRDLIKANVQHPDEEIARQADFLWSLFEKQGANLYRMGYARQSAGLNLLFQDLNGENAQEALEKLGAKTYYELLQSAQQIFEEAYRQRVQTESEKPNLPLLKEGMQKISIHTDELICVLNIMAQSEEDKEELDKVKSLASQINEVIDGFMSVARSRKTKSTKEAQKPF